MPELMSKEKLMPIFSNLLPDEREKELLFTKIDRIVNKNYIKELGNYLVAALPDELQGVCPEDTMCIFPITRFFYDRSEKNLQKLASVYMAAASLDVNIAMILNTTGKHYEKIEMYLAVCDENSYVDAKKKAEAISGSFQGNFPGSLSSEGIFMNKMHSQQLIEDCFFEKEAVCSVTGVASLREQDGEDNKSFYQGMEKIIEAIQGHCISVLIIAKNINSQQLDNMEEEYEKLYTALSPFEKNTTSLNLTQTTMISHAFTKSLTDSVGKTESVNISIGTSKGTSKTKGKGKQKTKGKGKSKQTSSGESIGVNATVNALLVQGGINATDYSSNTEGESVNYSEGKTKNKGSSTSNTNTFNLGNTLATAITNAVTNSDTDTISESSAKGIAFQIVQENKYIKQILEKIDGQIKRLKNGEGTGLFAVSTYFLSRIEPDAKAAASTYKAIITGNNTSLESASINTWSKKNNEYNWNNLIKYLKMLCHPEIELPESIWIGKDTASTRVTPSAVVTANELALHMSLPKNWVKGIEVRESVSFARDVIRSNIFTDSREIPLGKIYHLGQVEDSEVSLDANSLTMHTFIAGTNGAGKSNCIYQILSRLPENVHFLVIEPAKGEYKDVFSNRKDVSVYGTNPYQAPLIHINPFSFPEKIHVLEHIDGLLDIFNVCWPMYAAMPVVLRDSIERAYEYAGWNLVTSRNKWGERLYPTFGDVMHQINVLMDDSEYSGETKGDYKGALCTRLKSLTMGLNHMIFSADELSNEALFQQNVIIDISRTRSAETKALIMGILVMKLQEYRMDGEAKNNQLLNHVTVLEEAHHLLKRTSTEHSQESANLTGKSVELIANALAEIRTYGEGFIITDQSPGLMDLSVIRNTNTKIVFRLPELSDRELVGKAISLTDNQIEELPRLNQGVAAVYQNDWAGAVLAKIDKFEEPATTYQYDIDKDVFRNDAELFFIECLMKQDIDLFLERYMDKIPILPFLTLVKIDLIEYAKNSSFYNKSKLVYDFVDARKFMECMPNFESKEDIREYIAKKISLNLENDVVILELLYIQMKSEASFKKQFNIFLNSIKKNN